MIGDWSSLLNTSLLHINCRRSPGLTRSLKLPGKTPCHQHKSFFWCNCLVIQHSIVDSPDSSSRTTSQSFYLQNASFLTGVSTKSARTIHESTHVCVLWSQNIPFVPKPYNKGLCPWIQFFCVNFRVIPRWTRQADAEQIKPREINGPQIEITDNKLCLSQVDPMRDVVTSIKSILPG